MNEYVCHRFFETGIGITTHRREIEYLANVIEIGLWERLAVECVRVC